MRVLALAALVLAAFALTHGHAVAQDEQAFGQIERGRYLSYAGDCVACHTLPGGRLFAGGRAIETPFGILVSANITPDVDTGIGAWTNDEFYRAMHDGIGRDGSHLYPAFPYTAYTKVTREDADAIRAYLASVEPVRNAVQTNQLPFPYNLRASLGGWKRLYFTQGTYREDPGRTPQWNRGAYLVQGLGHCGTCHTPKTYGGGDQDGRFLHGEPLEGWYAPNITGDSYNGLGNWSVGDIVAYLRDGANDWSNASGPMAEVITLSTSHLTEADLTAMSVYLKDQAGPSRTTLPAPVAGDDARMRAGAAIYADTCAACHTMRGTGVARLFPRLAGAPVVLAEEPVSLIHVVLEGAQSVATPRAPTGPAMPAFGWKLDDAQVAAVVTYIRNAWGNAAPAVSNDTVRRARQ